MKIAAIVIGLVVLAAALVTGIGALMPATREGRAEARIAAPPDRVLAVIADLEAQADWRDGIAAVTRTATGWTETTARGEVITFTSEEMTATRIRLRFTSDAGYAGTWDATLTPDGDGTRIAVTESASVPNPLARIVARIMFDPQAFANAYLAALAARTEALP
jgi:carbon monoxide dehydrogenase subunit G